MFIWVNILISKIELFLNINLSKKYQNVIKLAMKHTQITRLSRYFGMLYCHLVRFWYFLGEML